MKGVGMNRLVRAIDSFLSLLGKILVGVLAAGVIVSVLLRYVFSVAFVWSEDLLTMVFVATTFFGAALGLREHEHIAITYFMEKASPKVRKVCMVATYMVIFIVSSFVCIYSIRMMCKVGGVPSPATGIPRGTYYAMIPVTFVLTMWYSIVGIVGQFKTIVDPVKDYKDDLDHLDDVTERI
jgi:TRAP-type C4-dicarboxylate transport system permease small subunit